MRDYSGATIAKRQVEELAIRAAQDFDAFYEQRAASRNPADDLLVISTDGKGIVMRHEDLREGTTHHATKTRRSLTRFRRPSRDSAGTVFEADGPVAQFDSVVAGWSMIHAKPGKHSYYVRSWASDFCARVDAEMVTSKIYVIALNARLGGSNLTPFAHFLSPGDPMNPAAPLGSLPFYTLDASAARTEIADHESQKADCMATADAAFAQSTPSLPVGFDVIDWTPGSAPH